jgi:hypothetical protein
MDLPGKEKEKEKRGLFFESGLDLRRPLPHLLGLGFSLDLAGVFPYAQNCRINAGRVHF